MRQILVAGIAVRALGVASKSGRSRNGLAVAQQHGLAQFQLVAGRADEALDVILIAVVARDAGMFPVRNTKPLPTEGRTKW